MAFLGQSYDTKDMPEGRGEFTPLPDGWYNATITKAEVKETKAKDGSYISVGYTITGPSHEGRVVFGNLNIRNKNPKAEEIGRQQLGDVMRAIGIPKVDDSDQLMGGNLSIKLATRKSEEYGDQNEVKSYKAIAGSVPPVASGGSSSSGGSGSKPKAPWEK